MISEISDVEEMSDTNTLNTKEVGMLYLLLAKLGTRAVKSEAIVQYCFLYIRVVYLLVETLFIKSNVR